MYKMSKRIIVVLVLLAQLIFSVFAFLTPTNAQESGVPNNLSDSIKTIENAELISSDFNKLLDEASMIYTQPNGFFDIPVTKNYDMSYDNAIKAKSKKLEIRYAIRPLGKMLERYKVSQKDPKSVMINPNKSYQSMLRVIVFNISGGHLDRARTTEYPQKHARAEFGADWGAAVIVPLKSNGFGKGYKNCLVVALHADNKADAYIFYLHDDESVLPLIMSNFYTLKFRLNNRSISDSNQAIEINPRGES